jgi:hypothetical protein
MGNFDEDIDASTFYPSAYQDDRSKVKVCNCHQEYGRSWQSPYERKVGDSELIQFGIMRARGAREFNPVRDLVAEGYVGKVLSCTMIITTPAWGTEFTFDWAYMADRSNGNTLLTSPGGHPIDALCYCLGEFKELSSVVANQRQRVKIRASALIAG